MGHRAEMKVWPFLGYTTRINQHPLHENYGYDGRLSETCSAPSGPILRCKYRPQLSSKALTTGISDALLELPAESAVMGGF